MSDDLAPDSTFPEFKRPPVIEVVCGVTFLEPEGLISPYLGLLWERFRTDYSRCEERPPLAQVIERPDLGSSKVDVTLQDVPTSRVWFIREDETAIIQVQRDRFLHNWKKVSDDDEYPRYSRVIAMFLEKLAVLDEFLLQSGFNHTVPIQYELTYVNHVPFGSLAGIADMPGALFRDLGWDQSKRFLPYPEAFNWRASFQLPSKAGRLHATVRTGKRTKDEAPVIVLDLTARGFFEQPDDSSPTEWFDLAHKWIVNGFVDLTTAEAQERLWGRTK